MLGKTENRKVWMDFLYPKEIFLALLYGMILFENLTKNNNTCFASAPGQWRPDTHFLLFSSTQTVYLPMPLLHICERH